MQFSRLKRREFIRLLAGGAAAVVPVIVVAIVTFSVGSYAQTVELPVRQTLLRPPGRPPNPVYSIPVRVGSTLIETALDTGSTGLRVLPNVLKPEDAQAGPQPEVYSYGSGIKLDGVVATAQVAFGNWTAAAFIQLVRTVGCIARLPSCPATRVGGLQHYGLEGQGIPDAGFKAIAGLRFASVKPGRPDNPLVAIGVPRYLIDLPQHGATGRIVLDPDSRGMQNFIELPNAADVFGDARGGTVPGCLLNLTSNEMICGEMLLDTGAPGITARVPGHNDADWPLNTPGRIIFGNGRGHALATVDFTAGPMHFAQVHIGGAPPQQRRPYINIGVTPYLAFTVLYDATRRGIALRPRPAAVGAPVGRVP